MVTLAAWKRGHQHFLPEPEQDDRRVPPSAPPLRTVQQGQD
jgi:hypothetical protein